MGKRTKKNTQQKIKCLAILLILLLFTACRKCEHIIYTMIENEEYKDYHLACLRANHIDFAVKDNGEIVTFKETSEELKFVEDKSYQAYRNKDIRLCF